jgi:hypothetical protein
MEDSFAILLLMIGYAIPLILAIGYRLQKEIKIAKQGRRIG